MIVAHRVQVYSKQPFFVFVFCDMCSIKGHPCEFASPGEQRLDNAENKYSQNFQGCRVIKINSLIATENIVGVTVDMTVQR